MEIFFAVLLGLIQGLTEFLPVSSSGHLVLFGEIFGVTPSVEFDLALHFGTLLSVAAYYFKDLLRLFVPPFKTLLQLVLATIPAAAIIFFFGDFVESTFTVGFLPIGFMISAIILFLSDRIIPKNKEVTYKSAIVSGLFQGLAVFPGISRSGATTVGGLVAGLSREDSVNFSFLMSVPIIAGSVIVMLLSGGLTRIDLPQTCAGVTAAFISGFFAIKIMVKLVKKARLKWFSLYLILLAVLSFLINIKVI